MFKYVVLAALLAVVFAAPEPKPGVLAAAPLIGAPLAYSSPLAYSAAYSSPIVKTAYAAPYVASPYAYSAGYASPYAYSAYSPYTAPLVKYY
ncbi:PREDICTED: neuropeptide-like 4 [Nicrophorus vespilloides]|uniref:Neuropeptide-like 4 n=1 Tax=Nicrophorus vespilloides TaxID=110193 RepID=A0ABM1MHK6_NICVS|nr:PREDICTED: neuropeptide-like 4 [Nicrophorus vespilloides]